MKYRYGLAIGIFMTLVIVGSLVIEASCLVYGDTKSISLLQNEDSEIMDLNGHVTTLPETSIIE